MFFVKYKSNYKNIFFNFSLTGARVQSQSEQIWMYNRYEIVMEYAKRPRLPPPFVVISYIGKNKKTNFIY